VDPSGVQLLVDSFLVPITRVERARPRPLVSVLCGGSSNRPRVTFQLRTTWIPADSTATRLRPSPLVRCVTPTNAQSRVIGFLAWSILGKAAWRDLPRLDLDTCTCAERRSRKKKGRGAGSSGSEGVEERSMGQRNESCRVQAFVVWCVVGFPPQDQCPRRHAENVQNTSARQRCREAEPNVTPRTVSLTQSRLATADERAPIRHLDARPDAVEMLARWTGRCGGAVLRWERSPSLAARCRAEIALLLPSTSTYSFGLDAGSLCDAT
jgi:hypothetical protein